jgi:hypothetical protein
LYFNFVCFVKFSMCYMCFFSHWVPDLFVHQFVLLLYRQLSFVGWVMHWELRRTFGNLDRLNCAVQFRDCWRDWLRNLEILEKKTRIHGSDWQWNRKHRASSNLLSSSMISIKILYYFSRCKPEKYIIFLILIRIFIHKEFIVIIW